MKKLLLLLFAGLSVFLIAGCESNDYFKDGYSERDARREDRRDRRAKDREEGRGFAEKTQEWFEDEQRKMDRDEWGGF